MEKYELQKLRDLPIEGVAERLGLRVCRHKCLCPFHDDHHASLSFSVSRNTFRCFACGAHGGTIDLVMKYQNVGFKEACEWLYSIDHLPLTIEQYAAQKEAVPNNGQCSIFNVQWYARFFQRPFLNAEARQFLFSERRLDERVVRWCRLTSWKDRRGVPWLQIPYYNRQGELVGVQNRNLKTPSNSPVKGEDSKPDPNLALPSLTGGVGGGSVPRFRFPQGSKCSIYNLPVLNLLHEGEPLYIAEGCSDCWSLLSAGHKAIAIPSATLLTRKDIEQLSIINSQLSIGFHMWPDNDLPGERLFLQLQQVLPGLEHHQLPPDCKDYSDLYIKGQIDN